jgi:hypothetical protein
MGQIDYLPIHAQQVYACLPGRMQNAIAPYPIPGMRKIGADLTGIRTLLMDSCPQDGIFIIKKTVVNYTIFKSV